MSGSGDGPHKHVCFSLCSSLTFVRVTVGICVNAEAVFEPCFEGARVLGAVRVGAHTFTLFQVVGIGALILGAISKRVHAWQRSTLTVRLRYVTLCPWKIGGVRYFPLPRGQGAYKSRLVPDAAVPLPSLVDLVAPSFIA